MKRRMSVCALAMGLSAVLMGAQTARAAFPERPIRVIVPFPAGGSADAGARTILHTFGGKIGGTIVIENRPGAGGNIGASAVARAAPDGHTLLFTSNSIAATAAGNSKDVPFDLRKDFVPISRAVSNQYTLLLNSEKLPMQSFPELLAYMRANPGKLDIASPGPMTSGHFALEEFKIASGANFNIIQYQGNAPANAAVMAGEPAVGIDGALTAKAAIATGRVRALAVTGPRRSPFLPNVPTIAESGVPKFEAGWSLVLLGPAGLSQPLVDQIYAALTQSLKDPATVKRLEELGFDVVGSNPKDYAASLEVEIRKSAKILEQMRASGSLLK